MRLSKDNKQTDKRNIVKDSKDKSKVNSLSHLSSNVIKCAFCKGSHSIYSCKDILSLPVNKRLLQVRKLKLCTNCLRNNHFNKDCKAGGSKKCSGRHNTLLHFDDSKAEQETNDQSNSNMNKAESSDKLSAARETTVATHAVQVPRHIYYWQWRGFLYSIVMANCINAELCWTMTLNRILLRNN